MILRYEKTEVINCDQCAILPLRVKLAPQKISETQKLLRLNFAQVKPPASATTSLRLDIFKWVSNKSVFNRVNILRDNFLQSEVPQDDGAGVEHEGIDEVVKEQPETVAEGEPPWQKLHSGEIPFPKQ